MNGLIAAPGHRRDLGPRRHGHVECRHDTRRGIPRSGSYSASASATIPAVTTSGWAYEKPYSAMVDISRWNRRIELHRPGPPEAPPPLILAALGPKMLQLAADRADGAHPYFVPPEHTAQAREILGPDKILAPEQTVVLSTDADRGPRDRAGFRADLPVAPELPQQPEAARVGPTMTWTTAAPTRSSTRSSPGETPERSAKRVAQHFEAGADHVGRAGAEWADDGLSDRRVARDSRPPCRISRRHLAVRSAATSAQVSRARRSSKVSRLTTSRAFAVLDENDGGTPDHVVVGAHRMAVGTRHRRTEDVADARRRRAPGHRG